ncbi:MAG: S24/S26 family peptidase [Betaproteobacteria bacterium]|nr:S24/S26 family peptidase [Betaproteobacteria bacterium]
MSAGRSRSRLLSALFGFLVPGLGHIYIGRARRIVLVAIAYFAVVFCLGIAGLLSTFGGAAVYVGLLLALYLFGIADPPIVVKPQAFEPKWYNRWYGYVGWIALVFIAMSVVPVIREPVLGFSVFRVPGTSMMPAIEPRDIVLVDTRAFADSPPALNDVVIVRGPRSGFLYVRRVAKEHGPDSLFFKKDNQEPSTADLELQNVPVSEALGRVTYVFYSWNTARIGRRIE